MKRYRILIALTLALALVLASLPALADGYSAIVTVSKMAVYSDAGLTSRIGSLPKNTVVTVRRAQSGVSLISYRGRTGYASSSDLTAVSDVAEEATVTSAGKVYESPSTSARSARLKKGWTIWVLAVKDGRAAIERGGYVGYTSVSNLSIGQQEAQPEEFCGTDCKDFSARVTGRTALYSGADKSSSSLLTLLKGADITVLSYNSSWAQVTSGGKTGYIPLSTVARDDSFAAKARSAVSVYASPSTSARKLGTLPGGAGVTVLAYTVSWSYISYNGSKGFCKNSSLVAVSEASEAPATPATPETPETPDEITDAEEPSYSTKIVADTAASAAGPTEITGSGAAYVYEYIRRVMGLNSAAACGIMVNLLRESGYNPTSQNATGHYGICQWGGSRRTNLTRVCEANGLDPATLEGQMYFLHYELRNSYKKTWSRLQSVSNSAMGAYEAGYYFCYNFEVPSSRDTSSVKRGIYAAETLFPAYTG